MRTICPKIFAKLDFFATMSQIGVACELDWWLATCAPKPKVPGSSPAASYVQR